MTPPVQNPESPRDEALLSWIQQFAPYGVVTLDESFRIRSWNHWMTQHSALKLADVIGQSLFTLYADLRERGLVPHFERALQGESSVLSTALHRYLVPLPSTFRETGVAFMLQTARISPLFSDGKICGIVVVIEDVTQRECQAQVLALQDRRNQLLSWALAQLLKTDQPQKAVRQLFFKIAEQLDFDAFLVYLRDPQTGILRLEALGGIPVESEADFKPCPFLTLVSPDPGKSSVLNGLSERGEAEFAVLRKARISAAVIVSLCANERDLGLLCFTTASRQSIQADESNLVETIAQYLATALDRENTNLMLRKAKEELSDQAQTLENRVKERTSLLQETVSELETFSYTIAHDLRAPARGTTGYCEILLEDFARELPPEAKAIVEKIARASRRMETLTRDLLEFSRISQQEVALAPVEIEPLIEEVAAQRAPAVRQAITIRAPLLPVRAHKGLLQHVLSNLIDNAVKFVPPNTAPKITIATETISEGSPSTRARTLVFSSTEPRPREDKSSSTSTPRNHVRIWVQDEGIGIPREAHQKIFGIFERGVTAELYQGTGIGLAIVARAMQRLGGTCGVESEPGKGSRFWLDLPAV